MSKGENEQGNIKLRKVFPRHEPNERRGDRPRSGHGRRRRQEGRRSRAHGQSKYFGNPLQGLLEVFPIISQAFQSFRETTPKYRSNLLRKLYNLCNENHEELSQILQKEQG